MAGVGLVFVFGGAAEGFGHYFCFAEEESIILLVRSISSFFKREKKSIYLQSLKSLRTSFKYVFRIFSTENTKQCWYSSRHSLTFANSLRVSSLPFLSTFVRWTTFARLDLGMVASWWVLAVGEFSIEDNYF